MHTNSFLRQVSTLVLCVNGFERYREIRATVSVRRYQRLVNSVASCFSYGFLDRVGRARRRSEGQSWKVMVGKGQISGGLHQVLPGRRQLRPGGVGLWTQQRGRCSSSRNVSKDVHEPACSGGRVSPHPVDSKQSLVALEGSHLGKDLALKSKLFQQCPVEQRRRLMGQRREHAVHCLAYRGVLCSVLLKGPVCSSGSRWASS